MHRMVLYINVYICLNSKYSRINGKWGCICAWLQFTLGLIYHSQHVPTSKMECDCLTLFKNAEKFSEHDHCMYEIFLSYLSPPKPHSAWARNEEEITHNVHSLLPVCAICIYYFSICTYRQYHRIRIRVNGNKWRRKNHINFEQHIAYCNQNIDIAAMMTMIIIWRYKEKNEQKEWEKMTVDISLNST